MNNNISNHKNLSERVYLVGIDLGNTTETEISLNELKELSENAGATVVEAVIQRRNSLDPQICVGLGKLQEIAGFVQLHDIDLIIFDIELTPSQVSNIMNIVKVAVIDRTVVILDIFAQRAKTVEGKLQVEMAQLNYLLPRLRGQGKALSRQGGGIGTRGPGETQLETDRRHIQRRINKIKNELAVAEKRRGELRKNRLKKELKTVAIVGYTNSGKSTLLNTLTSSDKLAENMLFATLDPTSRILELSNGRNVILVDTVGFIRNLPLFLVKAFQSTLEEVLLADLVLNVSDISSFEYVKHKEITQKILNELGYNNEIINVYNKCDKLNAFPAEFDGVLISAKNSLNLDTLKNEIEKVLFKKRVTATLVMPYVNAKEIANLRNRNAIVSENFLDDAVELIVSIDSEELLDYNKFLVK